MKKELLKAIDEKIEGLDRAIDTEYWTAFREFVKGFKPKEDKKPVEQRAIDFYEELKSYLNKYSPQMLREFYDYWTEKNKSGKKMRWEMEKTWDLNRRLIRWHRNNNKGQENSGKFEAKTDNYNK